MKDEWRSGGNLGHAPEAKEWLGIDRIGGDYIDAAGKAQCLTQDNDSRGLTFPQIANIIASKPKGLFVDETSIIHVG